MTDCNLDHKVVRQIIEIQVGIIPSGILARLCMGHLQEYNIFLYI